MPALKMVSGQIRETSNREVGRSYTKYANLIIDTTDGGIAHVPNALTNSKMPNALDPGTSGTFWFIRNFFNGRTLAATMTNGEFSHINMLPFSVFGLIAAVVSLPFVLLMPILGIPGFLAGIFLAFRGFRAHREIKGLKAQYAADPSVRILVPQII